MIFEPDGVFFKRTRDDTVSLLTWVDDIEATVPTEYWTLGHDATATFDHFELTNHQGDADTVPLRVRDTDKVEVLDLGVRGKVADPLHLAGETTQLSGFDSESRHRVHADDSGSDTILEVEQVGTSDYRLYVSEGDTTERVMTTGTDGSGNADTLDGMDSSEFLHADGSVALAGSLDVGTTGFDSDGGALEATADGWVIRDTSGDALLDARGGDVAVGGDLYVNGHAVLTTATDVRVAAQNDDGTDLVDEVSAITAGTDLAFGDDGDNTVTLSYTGSVEPGHAAVGTEVTASGDGTQTTFTLAHDLGETPDSVDVTPTSKAASTDFWVTGVDASAVTVEYPTAPPSGTDNLSWYVTAAGPDGLRPVSISDDGTEVLSGIDDLNFNGDLTVTDDGDNTITVGVSDHIADTTASETVAQHWHFEHGLAAGPDSEVGLTNGSQTTQFAWAYDATNDRAVFEDVANAAEAIEVDRGGTVNFPQNAQVAGTDVATTDDIGTDTDAANVTHSGDGSTRVFTLSHNLGQTPSAAFVQPTSKAAMSDFRVSNKTASDVVITYHQAPPAGDDNLSYDVITHA